MGRQKAKAKEAIGAKEFLLPSGEKVRMRGSSCATLTLTLSLKGEGISETWVNGNY